MIQWMLAIWSLALQFCSVQSSSHVQFFVTPWSACAMPPCPLPTPRVYSNSCPLSRWCIQSAHPLLSPSPPTFPPLSFPASGSFQMSQLFTAGGQSIGVSASASVLPMNTQDWSPLGWLVGSPCSPRDSQESSPTPQFQGINSWPFSFLCSPTLTSLHDYWQKT